MGYDGTILIEGAALIDGTGRAPVRDGVILIEGERIKAVGRQGQAWPPEARVIRAEGKFVIPGLIDSHVHWEDWMGEIFLLHGITTVLDTGALFPMEWLIAQKEGIAKGKILGPRLLTCGPILRGAATRRQGDTWYPVVESPAAVDRVCNELIDLGMDAIKMYTNLSKETMRAIADAAHGANLPTLGHINVSGVDAARAGLDSLAHATGVLEAVVRPEDRPRVEALRVRTIETLDPWWFMKFAHADADLASTLVKTLVAEETCIEPDLIHTGGMAVGPRVDQYLLEDFRFCENPDLRYIPEPFKAECLGFRRIYGWDRLEPQELAMATEGVLTIRRIVREFAGAGGKVLTASGLSHVMPGLSLHREMELLVDSGLTPMEALLGATRYAAEFLRRDRELGTVEAGKTADLVILDADPLADIGNTRRISQVIYRGRPLEMQYHSWHRNPIPQPPHTYVYGHFRPAISAIAPAVLREGENAELRVMGSGYVPDAVVRVGGKDVPTRFVDESTIVAEIPAEITESVGTYPVVVHKPQPTELGGTSDPVHLIVKFR